MSPVKLSFLLLAALAAAVLIGCGGATSPRSDDPKSVARAYYEAAYACGENGAGRQFDLSTSPRRDWTRDEYLAFQQRHGCQPQPVPPAQIALVKKQRDAALVEVDTATGPGHLVLVNIDGVWKVDTSRSDTPGTPL